MKRLFFLLFAVFLIPSISLAQGGYMVEITQEFPKKTSVYSNVFNIKRELDNAVLTQSAKLRGNNCNYKISIKTPSGSDTRYIQNIVWVESVNGAKTYHKKQTSPSSSYKAATNWQGYACTVDGSPKGTVKKEDFIYRVSLIGSTNEYETDFITEKSAKAQANHIYEKVFAEDHPVEVLVYKFTAKDTIAIDTLSNMKEYQAFLDKENTNTLFMTEANERQTIQTKINTFKERILSLGDSIGQLKSAMENCVTLLSDAQTQLSDSLFFAERMDSLYRDVLFNRIIPSATRKEKKRIQERVDDFKNDEHVELIKMLIFYTRKIEEKL